MIPTVVDVVVHDVITGASFPPASLLSTSELPHSGRWVGVVARRIAERRHGLPYPVPDLTLRICY